MIKRVSKIVILLIIASLAITFGWTMLQKLSHNRLVFETDIYAHIPSNNKVVIGFNRNRNFDKQFELDTLSYKIINSIKSFITFPLLIAKSDSMDEVLLTRVTRDQEEKVKKIFGNEIAPHHSPAIKKHNGINMYIYSLANNGFIVAAYHKGILATSKDYKQIENFLNNLYSDIENTSMVKESNYINRLKTNSLVAILTNNDSTRFALSHSLKDSSAVWSGKYFGKLEMKSAKLSNRKIDSLFSLKYYKTDSVRWEEGNDVELWINKLQK